MQGLWTFEGVPPIVYFHGCRVARFEEDRLIIETPLPRPYDLELLQIRETHLPPALPEWRARQGCFWLGDQCIFEWLTNINLGIEPKFTSDNELIIYKAPEPGHRSHSFLALWKTAQGFRLGNGSRRKFYCHFPELIDQLLVELDLKYPKPTQAVQQCRELIKNQTT